MKGMGTTTEMKDEEGFVFFQNWTQFPEEGSWRGGEAGTELKQEKKKEQN